MAVLKAFWFEYEEVTVAAKSMTHIHINKMLEKKLQIYTQNYTIILSGINCVISIVAGTGELHKLRNSTLANYTQQFSENLFSNYTHKLYTKNMCGE